MKHEARNTDMRIPFFKKITKEAAKINKRTRFVLSSFGLTGLLLLSTFFNFDKAPIFIPLFFTVVYLLTYFSVLEGIEKVERIMLFLMPIYFTIGFYLFYLLFPIRWLTRMPFFIIYGVSIYALLLVSNIFNVGVEKSLQLFRAAFSINYFYQIFVVFLFLNVLFSFKLGFLLNGIGVFLIIFPLSLQYLWSVKPKIDLDRVIIFYGLFISIICAELSMAFSFTPIKTSIFALFISTCYYSISGLIYAYIDERLFKEVVREYLAVLGFVIVVVILATSW